MSENGLAALEAGTARGSAHRGQVGDVAPWVQDTEEAVTDLQSCVLGIVPPHSMTRRCRVINIRWGG